MSTDSRLRRADTPIWIEKIPKRKPITITVPSRAHPPSYGSTYLSGKAVQTNRATSDDPEKEWPIYGVNNKEGIFLNSMQEGKEFNAPYKKIEKDWFFHNPTRANVGSLGIVSEVPEDAITSPEYQVWRLKSGFLPDFMALMLRTNYFLALVAFNRVGGVKQRMYYANLAEIRLPEVTMDTQIRFASQRQRILGNISAANAKLIQRKKEIEKMILGIWPVEVH